ncbi:alpha/beta-hydrolase [Exidia glandulosa HHB12029]|uniref:Alpha/beta-hydrolase n=1 Tax=Exidia glandulosa HHB12029 TaxID=1314781 RepID=A0A165K4A7_EXIGL|nr:alpha/beta-hydrolase [Exidia glandulosa HHB12029]
MPTRLSYPRPTPRPDPPAPFHIPAALAPLLAPPSDNSPPRCPPSRGSASSLSGWTRSTHVFPAAYPRVRTLLQPEDKISIEELKARLLEHHEGRSARLKSRNEVLWTVVERWTRAEAKGKGKGVTLFATHPNGMHKETWDETLSQLLSREDSGGSHIVEIWTMDAATQGDGGRVNAGKLPDIFDWTEYARDVLNFLLAYMPSSTSVKSHPSVLPRQSDAEISRRRVYGFEHRRIVALGHSMGSAAIVLACSDVPTLFSALALCDPVIVSPAAGRAAFDDLGGGALRRRDVWSSREEMREKLQKSPFFATWHPNVLTAYIEHGTYHPSNSSSEVRLKCTPYQEAAAFADMRARVYAWYILSSIPTRIPMLWVMSGRENNVSGGDADTPATVWRRAGNARNVRIEGAGHLVAQQAPGAVAEVLGEWLGETFVEEVKAKM